MPLASPLPEPLLRHACEPCRRKKTKCTAEKPTCSFCQRLNIQCTYLPRTSSHAHGVGKRGAGKSNTKNRFRQLERQISDLYGLLASSSNRQIDGPQDALNSFDGTETESPERSSTGHPDTQTELESPNHPVEFTLSRPEPPHEVLQQLVDVYRTRFHLQPLPLFHLEGLEDQLTAGPRFLLWSFLALILTISSHDFYLDKEPAAREFYARSSEDSVMKLASEGVTKTEVIQALCLIALKHIKTEQPARAWMAVGTASQLYALRSLFHGANPPASEDQSNSRVYWSVFLLERLFIPLAPVFSRTGQPCPPESAPVPPPVTSSTDAIEAHRSTTPGEGPTNDIGINGYRLQLASIWGKIRFYLHRLRQGEVEKPWLSESTHTKLSIELMEYESRLSRRHLLDSVEFTKRTAEEISRQLEYWHPWLATEILWHGAHAVLNHPFLHLVVLRSPEGIPQSFGFLQQKVDLALYHACWVFRLIQTSQDLLETADPLIGDVVAAVATVPWLFQFSKDTKVSQRAREDLERCEAFLSTMALTWPHVSRKLIILRKLRTLAEENRRETASHDATISFKPTWFWDLMDPKIHHSPHSGSPELDLVSGSSNDPDAKMCLKKHFVLPLPDDQDLRGEQQTQQSTNSTEPFFMSPENFEQFHIDELSRDFLQDGFWGQDY